MGARSRFYDQNKFLGFMGSTWTQKRRKFSPQHLVKKGGYNVFGSHLKSTRRVAKSVSDRSLGGGLFDARFFATQSPQHGKNNILSIKRPSQDFKNMYYPKINKTKCVTHGVIASDLGVDVGFVTATLKIYAQKGKRVQDQISPRISKCNKTTPTSLPSSGRVVESDSGSHLPGALSLTEKISGGIALFS